MRGGYTSRKTFSMPGIYDGKVNDQGAKVAIRKLKTPEPTPKPKGYWCERCEAKCPDCLCFRCLRPARALASGNP
jgi:hypothetical protein